MRFFFTVLLLCVWWAKAVAEQPPTPPNQPPETKPEQQIQIYSKQSTEAVDNLNKAAEVLSDPAKALKSDHEEEHKPKSDSVANINALKQFPRDPTQMSGNFRQALKNMPASHGGATGANPNAPAQQNLMPAIELAAKMVGKHKSVLLRVNKRVVQIAEGGQMSWIEGNQLFNIRIEKISKNQVRVRVLPSNDLFILQ